MVMNLIAGVAMLTGKAVRGVYRLGKRTFQRTKGAFKSGFYNKSKRKRNNRYNRHTYRGNPRHYRRHNQYRFRNYRRR